MVPILAAALRHMVLVVADGVGATRVTNVAGKLAVGVHAELRVRTI